MKKPFILCSMIFFSLTYSQVGINNSSPNSSLDITAKTPTGTANANVKDGIIVPRVDRARAQAMGNNTSPAVTESTLIYVNNVSTGTPTGSAANISAIGYYYFDSNALPAPGLWQPLRPSNFDMFATQLLIPPHNTWAADFSGHSVAGYDANSWWVISKSSSGGVAGTPARMTIVYEYQGTPLNIANTYPELTVGNNIGTPDVYTANLIGMANNGTAGRTRLTVSVVRAESFSAWGGTYLLNILLIKKL
jgi:hypothetical protein